MRLSEKQQIFAECVGELLQFISRTDGIDVTLGDAYRDPRLHGNFSELGGYGNSKSMHKIRLAIDLNLFVEGEYITDGGHDKYKVIGEYWESLDPFARWGGRFGDANHFSFIHWGCK